jgi:hypothetical protein
MTGISSIEEKAVLIMSIRAGLNTVDDHGTTCENEAAYRRDLTLRPRL